MPRARRASCSTRSCSRTSTRATCRSTSRPASTPCSGATACCWAAPSTASRTRRTRSTCGRASRRRAARRRSCSVRAAGITLQAQPTQGALDRRPVVLQLAGGAHPRVGQLPDDPGRGSISAATRSSSARIRSPRGARRAGIPAPVEHEPASSRREHGSLGDFGLSARWSPQWLDGTLGFYYRNATDILPQIWPRRASPRRAGRGVHGDRRHAAAGGNACIINANATTLADLQKFGKSARTDRLRRRHPHLRRHAGEEIAGVSVGAELSYRAEHAAAERTRERAARPAGAGACRLRSRPRRIPDTARRARWATRCTASSTRSTSCRERAVRHRDDRGRADVDAMVEVTQNEAVFKGRET